MNEQQIETKIRSLEQKISNLQYQLDSQKQINEEIKHRFQIVSNEIQTIQQVLNLR